LGAGAGYFVAKENQQYAGQEQMLRARIAAARQEVSQNQSVIAATNGEISRHRREIGVIRAAYRQGEKARNQYQAESARLQDAIGVLQTRIGINQQMIIAINKDLTRLSGPEQDALRHERDTLLAQQQTMKQRLRELTGLQEAIPTS